ncbi:MAG: dihydrolipoyl dehydrogenase [Myxococcota bacterium]
MASDAYDLVVIGGGPGGYVAALRAAQLGLRVACVERRGRLGGTCLNVGCIPSKALLHSSERYAQLRHGLGDHGIVVGEVELDLGTMMARKDKVVADLGRGIDFLLEKNGVARIEGFGSIPEPGIVSVELPEGGPERLSTRNVLIATGSEPARLPGLEVDEKQIVSSTGALALERVPERLAVIGAGAIGLELGSVWSRLGAEVTVIEIEGHVLPGMDREISKLAQRVLKRQGLRFELATRVQGATREASGLTLRAEALAGGEARELPVDVALVAIGRVPFTEGLGLETLGVERDERGFLRVDPRYQTSVPGVFAIGDCVPGPMLAHKAEEEGVACVEMLAGQQGHVDHDRVPSVVYTWPEVASVGRTQEQLEADGIRFSVGRFPFSANSRARITGDAEGLVKILADARSDAVLGVHILGPLAGDLIAEAVLALEFGASAEDIARTCHAHPATGEAIKEAALSVAGRALHA